MYNSFCQVAVPPNGENNYKFKWVIHAALAKRLRKSTSYLKNTRVKKGIRKYLKIMVEYLDNERYNEDNFLGVFDGSCAEIATRIQYSTVKIATCNI